MKALLVIEPGIDGVFRYVESLCHFLTAQGVDVHLAYSDRRGSGRLNELVAWVEAHGGRTLNLRVANRPEPADLRAFGALLRLVWEVRPDVIHSHSAKGGFLARALVFLGVRAVQVYHPHAYVGMRPVVGRFDAVYNAIEGVLGRVSHTIVVSRDEHAFAHRRLRIPARRLHLIPNGVDPRIFAPGSPDERRRQRAARGLPTDVPLLGFLGRTSPQKDPLTLYRAFARAAAKRPMALYHVGHGELDAEVNRFIAEAGIGDRVFREDYTAAPAEFYRLVDGFILTSRYEGLSLAALEALATDLPLILSDAPGNRDMLALPLSHGWGAAPADVEAFARAIEAWHESLESPAPRNHRRLARTYFDPATQFGQVLDRYHAWSRKPATVGRHPRAAPLKTGSPPP